MKAAMNSPMLSAGWNTPGFGDGPLGKEPRRQSIRPHRPRQIQQLRNDRHFPVDLRRQQVAFVKYADDEQEAGTRPPPIFQVC